MNFGYKSGSIRERVPISHHWHGSVVKLNISSGLRVIVFCPFRHQIFIHAPTALEERHHPYHLSILSTHTQSVLSQRRRRAPRSQRILLPCAKPSSYLPRNVVHAQTFSVRSCPLSSPLFCGYFLRPIALCQFQAGYGGKSWLGVSQFRFLT